MKAFITVFNRLTYTKQLAEQLSNYGLEVIIIDNKSTYKPLLEWYKECPYKAHRMRGNYTASVFFQRLKYKYKDRYIIITDPDMDISGLPADWISILLGGLYYHPNVQKAGLSLKVDDLPDNDYTRKVIEHEQRYWLNRSEYNLFFHADVGNTLAVYDMTKLNKHNSIRSDSPYTAKHLDWYLTKETVTDEDLNYIETSKNIHYGWTQVFKELIYDN